MSAIRGQWCARDLPERAHRKTATSRDKTPASIRHRKYGCARRRHHVPDLKLGRIDVIAPRHAEDAKNELRKERHVESKKNQNRRSTRPVFRVQAAGDFRPPVVQAAEIGGHHATHHDVVEMSDHEISVGYVDVVGEAGEKQPRQSPDCEEADEAERIKHRRVVTDPAFVHRRRPIEDLDCRRHRDNEAHERKNEAGERRLPTDKHVVAPDEEADAGDSNRRPGDEFVTEDFLAGVTGDQLADHAHAGQDHDVDGRMRVEPEQVLEQQRVAAARRIENAYAE